MAARPRPRAAAVALAGLAALAAVACWPLVRGQALDSQLTWDEIPPAWTAAADHVDATVGEDGRAVVLPGQLYADYDWGGTVDAILPALAERPVAVRYAVPYADLRAVDLLWTVDGLVAAAPRAARASSARCWTCCRRARSWRAPTTTARAAARSPAADAADVLDQLGAPDEAWGPVRREPRAAGTLGRAAAAAARAGVGPAGRAADRARWRPTQGATVVDGSADALAGLAAFGALPAGRIAYAGDVERGRAAPARREVVISDSNRRRVLAAARMAQNHGADARRRRPVLARRGGRSTCSRRAAPTARPSRPTTAPATCGCRSRPPTRSSRSGGRSPPSTATPRPTGRPTARSRRRATGSRSASSAPRDVDAIELLPYSDRRAKVTAVEVAGPHVPRAARAGTGSSSACAACARCASGSPAWSAPEDVPEGAGGIRELRIPGVRVREALRPPVLAERALAGRDLDATGLTYLFERTTGDDPFRRDPRRGTRRRGARARPPGRRARARARDRARPPRARGRPTAGAPSTRARRDSAVDALAGAQRRRDVRVLRALPGPARASAPRARSTARRGRGSARGWTGAPRGCEWTTPAARDGARAAARAAARDACGGRRWCGCVADGARDARARRSPRTARVTLPEPLRGRTFRLEILRAAFPAGATGVERQRRAVGIREITGAGVPIVPAPRGGRVRGVAAATSRARSAPRGVRMRVDATVADLDAGRPLRFRPCGAAADAARRPGSASRSPPGTFAPYLVRLRSPAPDPPARAAAVPGRVLDTGDAEARRAHRRPARACASPPGSCSASPTATPGARRCDGRDLGAPVPVDGFAMGWRVPAGCRARGDGLRARRARARGLPRLAAVPARDARAACSCAPPARAGAACPTSSRSRRAERMPAGRAAVLALLAGAVLGFVFAARARAADRARHVPDPVARGRRARRSSRRAGALLLVAVPVLTLAIGVEDRGGYNPEYAQVRIAVHWVAVAAVILLVLALARVLGAARRRRSPA